MIDVDRYIPFLDKNKLTQEQFLLCYLLYLPNVEGTGKGRFDLIRKYKEMYPTPDGSMIGKVAFERLIERGFINRLYPNAEKADEMQLGQNFLDAFIDEYQAGEEIWELYPRHVTMQGKVYPMKSMDANKFRLEYGKRIKYSREEHEEVKKDLQWMIDNNKVYNNIEKFLLSEEWKDIRKIRVPKPVEETSKSDEF